MAIAVALLGVHVSAASAAKTVPSPFVGVVADGPLLDDPNVNYAKQLDLMVASGVQTMRASFNWTGIQRYKSFADVPPDMRAHFSDEDGVPTDYTATDQLVGRAAERHISVLPVLITAPGWAARYPGRMSSPPSDFGAYARFAAALVRRYGPTGSFWSENPAVPKVPIRYWQIWNEPSFLQFWEDRPWAGDYVKMLKRASKAIHQADHHAKVVLAGLPNASWYSLHLIYKAGGRRYFDVAAFHPFTAKVGGVRTILERNRKEMAAHGDRRKPLMVTELSWTAAKGKTHITYGNEQTAKGQARNLSAAYKLLARLRKQLRIERVYWYTWASYDKAYFFPFDWAGLIKVKDKGYTRKPAFRAFQKVALQLEGCHSKRGRADRCAS